jgi:hypothetical protein
MQPRRLASIVERMFQLGYACGGDHRCGGRLQDDRVPGRCRASVPRPRPPYDHRLRINSAGRSLYEREWARYRELLRFREVGLLASTSPARLVGIVVLGAFCLHRTKVRYSSGVPFPTTGARTEVAADGREIPGIGRELSGTPAAGMLAIQLLAPDEEPRDAERLGRETWSGATVSRRTPSCRRCRFRRASFDVLSGARNTIQSSPSDGPGSHFVKETR